MTFLKGIVVDLLKDLGKWLWGNISWFWKVKGIKSGQDKLSGEIKDLTGKLAAETNPQLRAKLKRRLKDAQRRASRI